ncbi:MAG: hypothetical protein R3F61_25510 [Myxococcota bacterium]
MLVLAILGCSRTPPVHTDLPGTTGETGATPHREWVDVTPYPCGVDSEGWVECWTSQQWADMAPDNFFLDVVPPSPFPTRVRDVTIGSLAWGMEGATPRIWACFEDMGGDWCADPPPVDFDMIGTECGLADGEVLCWGHIAAAPFPDDRTYRLFHGPYSAAYAALTTDNEIVIRGETQDPLEYPLDPALEIETLVSFDVSGACVLTTAGNVDCMGPGWVPEFTHPPYRRLAGGFRSVCAVRQDWVIECGEGTTFDFGPIRALSVYSHERMEPVVPPPVLSGPRYSRVFAQVSDPPHVCVVTEDNAVRCEGWRYAFDDLQAKLPKGDSAP